MAARVRVRGEWIEHPKAEALDVRDGHLHVFAQQPGYSNLRTIAAYRPETWYRAEMLDDWATGGQQGQQGN